MSEENAEELKEKDTKTRKTTFILLHRGTDGLERQDSECGDKDFFFLILKNSCHF